MAIFKVGDIVKLKSGGPDMCVSKVTEEYPVMPTYHTDWFAGNKAQRRAFNEGQLEAVTDDAK